MAYYPVGWLAQLRSVWRSIIRKAKVQFQVKPYIVCYTAVFSVVTQCSSPLPLCDDTKNGCVAD